MRVNVRGGFSRLVRVVVVVAIVVSSWVGGSVRAQSLAASELQTAAPRTSLVIFADSRMEDREWNALFDVLRRDLRDGEAETRAIAGNPEMIRGDAVKAGMRVETAVVVHLHGDCRLAPVARRTAYGVPLGWVRQVDGHIEPFAHVDCTRIGEVLGPQALGMTSDRRNAVIAGAIARVILHEWIHIATQSRTHAERGITKAQFGVADLMASGDQPVAQLRIP